MVLIINTPQLHLVGCFLSKNTGRVQLFLVSKSVNECLQMEGAYARNIWRLPGLKKNDL